MFKTKWPLELQLHAEDAGQPEPEQGNEPENKPSYEELVQRLAKAEALATRNKNALDNASRQAADFKRQLREKQSEQERNAADEEERLAELESLRKKVKRMSLKDSLTSISMQGDMADKCIDAILDGNTDDLIATIGEFAKAIKAQAMQEFLGGREKPKGGTDDRDTESDAVKYARLSAERMKTDGKGLEKFF